MLRILGKYKMATNDTFYGKTKIFDNEEPCGKPQGIFQLKDRFVLC